MSYGDSSAVFKQRAEEIGVSEAVLKAFTDEGLNTMATFAFSCNYAPGASDEAALVEMIKKTLAREPTMLELSLRRLFNELYANIASDITARTEQTDETQPVGWRQPRGLIDCGNSRRGSWGSRYLGNTSSTAQGGGGSFKKRKTIGEIGCCESRMSKQRH